MEVARGGGGQEAGRGAPREAPAGGAGMLRLTKASAETHEAAGNQ